VFQIRKNMKLYELSNDVPLSTHAAAHFTRGEIAGLIRSNPHSVQSLLAGTCARLAWRGLFAPAFTKSFVC
jgi:hypothetical protein